MSTRGRGRSALDLQSLLGGSQSVEEPAASEPALTERALSVVPVPPQDAEASDGGEAAQVVSPPSPEVLEQAPASDVDVPADANTGTPARQATPRRRRSPASDATAPAPVGPGEGGELRAPHAVERPEREPKVRINRIDWMERKEVYLWPDQLKTLRDAEFALNRARGRGTGERITVNSLLRVAIDALLPQLASLHGVDENELLTALGLPTRTPQGQVETA